MNNKLNLLLIEDDQETLEQLQEILPKTLAGFNLHWDFVGDFDSGLEKIDDRYYDIVVTDIYRNNQSGTKGGHPTDEKAADIVDLIRARKFTPIIAYTTGSAPTRFQSGNFLKLVDKTKPTEVLVNAIAEIIQTGIPKIARTMKDELEAFTGSYLWGFLDNNWSRFPQEFAASPVALERVLRRRAAIQLGRLDGTLERESVDGGEFYIWPSISGSIYRLGEVLKKKADNAISVLLTPHCLLHVQNNATLPRAEFVLTVKTTLASDIFSKHPLPGTTKEKRLKHLRKALGSPSQLESAIEGRYWFMPGFLDLEDRFCDLIQVESIPFAHMQEDYERLAVLDSPFAEALQACFVRFYSSVGISNLVTEQFSRLLPTEVDLIGPEKPKQITDLKND